MPTDLSRNIGSPIYFSDGYFFKGVNLPNATTIQSTELELNNTQASVQVNGTIDTDLTLSGALTVEAQYKDETGTWQDEAVLFSQSSGTLSAGVPFFKWVPVPDSVKRVFRLVITAAGDLSAVKIAAAIETIP